MATAELKTRPADQDELEHLRRENARLKRRIEDRAKQEKAKWLLVAYFRCTEAEAHRYLMRAASRQNARLEEVIERLASIAEAIELAVGDEE